MDLSLLTQDRSLSNAIKKFQLDVHRVSVLAHLAGCLWYRICSQGLDEVQSYILLRRWLSEERDTVIGEALSQQQRASLQAFYFNERIWLLRSLDYLLQLEPGESLLLATLQPGRDLYGCYFHGSRLQGTLVRSKHPFSLRLMLLRR